jgi:isopenicillin N synthase-like dioxygenase
VNFTIVQSLCNNQRQRTMSDSGALPVVDLSPFFAQDDAGGGVARATEAVREACRTHGFFRAVNHGVPADLMARALQLSAAFFALPDEEKAKVRPAEGSDAPLPAGYARQPAHSADKNEYVLVFDPKLGFNVYPAEPAGFRSVVEIQYKFAQLLNCSSENS